MFHISMIDKECMEAARGNSSKPIEPDAVATLVLDKFKQLPAKNKPINGANGSPTWVVLSGIVIAEGQHRRKSSVNMLTDAGPNFAECVALA